MFKELALLSHTPPPPPPPPQSLCLLLLVLLLLFSFSQARCLSLSSACLLPRASLSVLAFYAPFFRFSVAARVAACEAYVHFYGLQRSPDCGTVGLTDGPTEGFYDFVMKFVRCKFDVASGCFSYLPTIPTRFFSSLSPHLFPGLLSWPYPYQ